MPQLDFFIFTHIAIESIIVLFMLFFVIYNTSFIYLYKGLKTRKLFVTKLAATNLTSKSLEIPSDDLLEETIKTLTEQTKHIKNVF